MSVFSAVIVIAFIFLSVAFPTVTSNIFGSLKTWVTTRFNHWFVIVINIILFGLLILAFTKYGKTRIGYKNDTKPIFSRFTWYAMLFSAGIGIGIFFYGIAEPISNLSAPDAINSSSVSPLSIMFLHYGFHPWAVYALVAIGIGYFSFNKGLPVTVRSLFYPILKDRIFGIWGDIIDTIAVLSVLFGLSTSLGLGASQINAGINSIFSGIPISPLVQIIIIIVITFIATLSVVSGIGKGIKILSELNIRLSAVFLLIIVILGPTVYIFRDYAHAFFIYIFDFFKLSTYVADNQADLIWQSGWTIFYWCWWFSWSPFVGLFIARISRGRTIRDIVFGVILVPTVIITFAMSILGATGLNLNETNNNVMTDAVNNNLATSLFVMLRQLISNPILLTIFSILALIVIILFFVTSSDSGSLVVDNLTSGGKLHSPKTQRVFWAAMEGLIAAAALLLGGTESLNTLQSILIIMGLPFSIMLLMIIFSLSRQLYLDHKPIHVSKKQQVVKELSED